ncbi:MAG: hypothetical protein JW891_18845 [Candidatus Lokiarchaeota archaeon]|nr:hypothetical protein [Candidatus Lokiarchaeota archaeon]
MVENTSSSGIRRDLNCYLKIIDTFQKYKHLPIDFPQIKSKAIIKLINTSECKNDRNFVKNALLLVLSLYDKKPMDIYNTRGYKLEDCTNDQKKDILLKLQKELP